VSLVVVGSVALDTLETPHGRATEVLGGAASYFAIAASFFGPVQMVAVVGEDFPRRELDWFTQRGVDLAGVDVRPGRSLRWSGRYHEDMNVRDTLAFEANVFEQFAPELPAAYRDASYVFLANIAPTLQARVLDQVRAPRLVGADTMNLWIDTARADLTALLRRVPLLMVNDEEARMLSGERNMVRAARRILAMGPESLMIKRGEYGVLYFSGESVFAVPATRSRGERWAILPARATSRRPASGAPSSTAVWSRPSPSRRSASSVCARSPARRSIDATGSSSA